MATNFLYKRILIVSILIILVGGGILTKLFFLQVVRANQYENKAESQYVLDPGTQFSRGSIFFTTKDEELISAATVVSGYKVALNPSKLLDIEKAYQILLPYLKISKEVFVERAEKDNDVYEEVATHLSESDASEIRAQSLPGISLYRDTWRFYPGGTLGSQITGFVGYKGDTFTGRYGIEQKYNAILGGAEDAPSVNFFAEVFANLREIVTHENKKQGDIVTTIDPYMQATLETALLGVQETWSSEKVGGIIINPHTGEIVAMANTPSFDPNTYGEVTNQKAFSNGIVEDVFEIGSVMKTITMASGLDAGVITESSTYKDTGPLIIDKKQIRNVEDKYYGITPMQTILSKSLNTGATFIMQKLGRNSFREYMERFGFTEKTGIDLPGEAENLIENLYATRDVEYATASFGQGIAVTPISAVRAFSVIANGGYLPTPHVVKEIRWEDGTIEKMEYEKGRQVISKETSDIVRRMMVTVVDKELLGGTLKFKHYTAGSKTGTAQLPDPTTGKYSEDRYLHTMYAFFPGYEPKYLVFMYNVNPRGIDYASKTLSKPVFDVGEAILTYYNISPDR